MTKRRRAAVAAVLWSAAFAAIHVYWASGGRRGLGTVATEADDALATGWFAVYNAGVAVLSIGAAVAAAAAGLRRTSDRVLRLVRTLFLAAAAVLLVRGCVGIAALLADAVNGGRGPAPPLILVLIEPSFVVGGLAFASVARVLRRDAKAEDLPPDGEASGRDGPPGGGA